LPANTRGPGTVADGGRMRAQIKADWKDWLYQGLVGYGPVPNI